MIRIAASITEFWWTFRDEGLRGLWQDLLCWWFGCKMIGYMVPTDYGDEWSVYCDRCGRSM